MRRLAIFTKGEACSPRSRPCSPTGPAIEALGGKNRLAPSRPRPSKTRSFLNGPYGQSTLTAFCNASLSKATAWDASFSDSK
jgi:hypothetical protein